MAVKDALKLDEDIRTSSWMDAIKKEMKNVRIAFKFLERGEKGPLGYQKVPCHLIFDVKMDFMQKARFVAGGHVTKLPIIFNIRVSCLERERERVCISYFCLLLLTILTY